MNNSIPDKYRRILVIDDNQSIHKDFKAILDPDERKDDELDQMAAAIFDEDHKTPDRETFHVESAYQGQQGLEMIKKANR
ncbi:MAG: GGDEF domain-containing response regulator, partial [Planctomycetes bacterium]|nr:GGDEF domain-containing response regulator [Planctomycetota bacterium]